MTKVLSPKQLARAIGVSESSLKRWSDDGLLNAGRTAGGHRRIELAEAVRFIRATGASVVRPDLIGLADLAALGPGFAQANDVERQIHKAMESGNSQQLRAMLQSLYLAGWSLAAIFDGPMRSALVEIGKMWLHQEWGLVVEHRATEMCIEAVNQLRMLCTPRQSGAPVAVGSAAEFDPYMLPSLMVATVAGEAGFMDVNLGTITPPSVLLNAARHYQASLAWVSLSASPDAGQTVEDLQKLHANLAAFGCSLLVGGRLLASIPAERRAGLVVVSSMAEFASLASSAIALRTASGPHASTPATLPPHQ